MRKFTKYLSIPIFLIAFNCPASISLNVNEALARRIGFYEGVLPSLIFLQQELAAFQGTKDAQGEALASLKTWMSTYRANFHLLKSEGDSSFLPFAYLTTLNFLFEQFEFALRRYTTTKNKNYEFTAMTLSALLSSLSQTIHSMQSEIRDRAGVSVGSSGYRLARHLGLAISSRFFLIEVSAPSKDIELLTNLGGDSLFYQNYLDLVDLKIAGIGLSLQVADLNLVEFQKLLLGYSAAIQVARQNLPVGRKPWFKSEFYSEKVSQIIIAFRSVKAPALQKMRESLKYFDFQAILADFSKLGVRCESLMN